MRDARSRVSVSRGRRPDDAPEVAVQLALVVEPDRWRDLGCANAALKQLLRAR
jgi:hypothetical protein